MRMIASKDNNQRINRAQEWWFFYINFCTFHLQWYHCIPHFEAEAWGDLEMIYLIEVEEVIRVQEESQFYVSPVKYGRGFLPWDIHTGRFFKFGFILISRWIILALVAQKLETTIHRINWIQWITPVNIIQLHYPLDGNLFGG